MGEMAEISSMRAINSGQWHSLIWQLQMAFDCDLDSIHIPGWDNCLADLLSRKRLHHDPSPALFSQYKSSF
jgi:hypothetical protein